MRAWLTVWLRDWKAPTVQNTTLASYEHWLRALYASPLADAPLMPLTPLDAWQAFFASLHGRAAGTARNLRRILIDALDVAVDAGKISHNLVRRTKLPAYRPKRASLSPEQCATLLAHVAGDRLEVAVWLGLCGLRRGELCGLRWEHITGDDAFVCEQSVIVPGGRETRAPKRGRTRHVTLPPQVVTVLRHHRERQRVEALTNARPVPETVLTNTRGAPLSPGLLDDWYKVVRDACGLPGTLHSLRRTSATLAQQQGGNLRDVLAQLGHANLDQTLLYTDSTESGRRDAAQALGRVLPWPKAG